MGNVMTGMGLINGCPIKSLFFAGKGGVNTFLKGAVCHVLVRRRVQLIPQLKNTYPKQTLCSL